MEMQPFRQVITSGEALLKDRASKFYAYAFACPDLAAFEAQMAECKKQHPTARHFCWAGRWGQPLEERANDAGEPAHSAGAPILHALQSAEVLQSSAIVVRYFGGTKLGVPGLIAAYRAATEEALAVAHITEVFPMIHVTCALPYERIGSVELLLRQVHAQIIDSTYGTQCHLTFSLKQLDWAELQARLKAFTDIDVVQSI